MRNLVLILGDQLDADSAVFDGFDARRDRCWMAEVAEESTHVWSHQARTALFLAAMRHFRDRLPGPVDYVRLDDKANTQTLSGELARAVKRWKPERLVMVQAGDWRVDQALRATAQACGVELEIREDRHFLCPIDWFRQYADGRKQMRLEFFYREMRRMHGVLMDGKDPVGGQWNFDAANRESFGKRGPGLHASPVAFTPDEVTREVLELVARRFAGHPGRLERFDWPVTAEQALVALDDFVTHRLPEFGRYQDAMWTEEPWLFHSRLAAAMNLKLLPPRVVIERAVAAWREGRAPLEAVEGFVRQILGWREYVRGIYWTKMPEYAEGNALEADRPLPKFFWTGETEMACLRAAIGQTLEYGYAHHIQRLMVTGLYALLYGVRPREIHEWYLAVYVDAVEWVELPNVIGMSQFADGGYMATKPYAATGKYIDRMSNYCRGCRYDPAEATGPEACPFTTLYWEFLIRNEERLRAVPRMELQLKNLVRIAPARRQAILDRAEELRA